MSPREEPPAKEEEPDERLFIANLINESTQTMSGFLKGPSSSRVDGVSSGK